jgi:hypothetical protein
VQFYFWKYINRNSGPSHELLVFPYSVHLGFKSKKLAVAYLGSVDGDVGGLNGHDRGILNHQSATYNNNH